MTPLWQLDASALGQAYRAGDTTPFQVVQAHLERLGQGRGQRLSGALTASQSAQGQTAAVQSSNQMLAVLAEDLAALRVLMLAQARLLSEGAARDAAERTAGAEARRRSWARPVAVPSPPAFDPLSNARN